MNWQKVIGIAFGLSVMFTYFPVIAFLAGIIILAIYNRQDVKELAGKSVSFAQVLCLSFAIAVATQAVLTLIFGARFEYSMAVSGLFTALDNPDAIKALVAKEVFALIIVFCVTYLVVTSTRPNRWVFKLAIVFSLVALIFQCWHGSLSKEQQNRHDGQLSLLRDAVIANVDSRINDVGLLLKRDTVISKQPACYYALADAHLYFPEGDSVQRGEPVKVDSKWFLLTVSDNIVDPVTGISYSPVASYDDETKTGWLRVDQMSKSPVTPPIASSLSAIKAKSPIVDQQEILDVVPLESVKQLKSSVLESEKNSNAVVVSTGSWTPSGFDKRLGEKVQLGPFIGIEDINRLEVKVGDKISSSLKYLPTNDGLIVVLNCSGVDDTVGLHPIELHLKYGLPLSVTVQKL